MTADTPNRLDRAIAYFLSFRPLVLGALVALAAVSLLTALATKDTYAQSWATEVFGASLLFIALFRVDPSRMTLLTVAFVLGFGVVFGLSSYPAKAEPPLDAIFIEVSSGLVMFALLEVAMRRILLFTKSKQARYADQVKEIREQAIDKAAEYVTRTLKLDVPDKFEENMKAQIFGGDWEPGLPLGYDEEPGWEERWKTPL